MRKSLGILFSAENERKSRIWLAVVYTLLAVVLTAIIIIPFYNRLNAEKPYLWINAGCILLVIFLFRWIFMLKWTLWPKSHWPKILLLLASIPLGIKIFAWISQLNGIYDQDLMQDYFKVGMPFFELQDWIQYYHGEFLFFGVAALILLFIADIRMIMSIYRVINNRGI